MRWWIIGIAGLWCVGSGMASDDTVARGREALFTRSFVPAFWSKSAYDNVWKQWGVSEKPADYDHAFMDRYGLHPAPYANDGLPMGLKPGTLLFRAGLAVDCMVCHAGSIAGQSYIGLGNSALDVEALFNELTAADGINKKTPFRFTRVRGTNEAGGMGVYLLGFRNADLSLKFKRTNLGLHDDLCEDVPAWWLLKKKKTMYYTGGADARSVRSLMQFMLAPTNTRATFERDEPVFRDIQAYLLSLEAPKYPFHIDRTKAKAGAVVFKEHCASCHGTYGKNWTYPNRHIPLDVIGTDRRRYEGITETYGRAYNESWFARENRGWLLDESVARYSPGYQAPPLDGIWATAPYLHNGSVPTLYHLLKSDTRPQIFTRSYRTDLDAYDRKNIGWKISLLSGPADPKLPLIEQKKVYDTTQTGRGNGGHTFGDDLTDDERWAVIEYLKTL
jgi:hypothetical protein